MIDNSRSSRRKSLRLPTYDYTQEGAYYVTVVTRNHKCLFGHIELGEMYLNQIGKIVKEIWRSIPMHFPQASVDCFIIMPNHIHGIINLAGARHAVPLRTSPLRNIEKYGKPIPGSIPTIIRSFKSEVTRRVNLHQNTPGAKLWQRNYYERVISDENDYQLIYDYILINPQNWQNDDEFLRSIS